ncbi:MAG: hypothetical protein QOG61_1674 [Candidatus Binataceae bacterium]|jgi:hypothetical protein|nr:hypothetical protein [Candidatus Binataceae bacterium]
MALLCTGDFALRAGLRRESRVFSVDELRGNAEIAGLFA